MNNTVDAFYLNSFLTELRLYQEVYFVKESITGPFVDGERLLRDRQTSRLIALAEALDGERLVILDDRKANSYPPLLHNAPYKVLANVLWYQSDDCSACGALSCSCPMQNT